MTSHLKVHYFQHIAGEGFGSCYTYLKQQGLLVRFCIGLEHPADLIQDIENALKQLNNHHKKIE
jgi:cystathionine beta-lyase/cystathionine gamma-synthase